MSMRENVRPVLCIIPAPHSEQVVHEGHGHGVCGKGGGGGSEKTEILLIQTECGGEALRVNTTSKLASRCCNCYRNRCMLKKKKPGEIPLLDSKC